MNILKSYQENIIYINDCNDNLIYLLTYKLVQILLNVI